MLQTILIPRSNFTLDQAIEWLKQHGHSHKKVDETEHFYRFRQLPPGFNRYYTKTLPNGIELVHGIV